MSGRVSGTFPLAAPPPPEPWYLGESWVAKLSGDAQARIERWKARWDAKVSGGPVLSLTELGSLIKKPSTPSRQPSPVTPRS